MNSTDSYVVEEGIPSGPLAVSAVCFTAMGLLCCVQMYFLIGVTFRKRSGLYFWSLTGATSAQFIVCFSILLQHWILRHTHSSVSLGLGTVGYLFFPLFGYLILYSRLYLLQSSKRVLRIALALIVLEWVLAELPLALLGIIQPQYPNSEKMALAYKISWEIEEGLYSAVDLVLCWFYLLQIKRLWGNSGDKTRGILWKVAFVSFVSLAFDVAYIVLQNTTNWHWSVTIGAFLMALKLHIEIYILNMLTEIAKAQLDDMRNKFSLSLEFCTTHPSVQSESKP